MSNKKMPKTENPDTQRKIRFHYQKTNQFRNVRIDGIFGGITATGNIQMDFFSERNPIPKALVFPISPAGVLGDEVEEDRQTKDGVVRDVEFSSVIDVDKAKALVSWLNDKIQAIEGIQPPEKQE